MHLVCYAKKFGPKGYGYGQGGGALQSECILNGYVDLLCNYESLFLFEIVKKLEVLFFIQVI